MRRVLLEVGAVLAIALAVAGTRLAGYTPYVVVSGSMEPTVPAGSVIIVQATAPADVHLGDVITFTLPDRVVTHRVQSIASTDAGATFTTRGDANSAADPWLVRPDGNVGVVRLIVPLVGLLVAAAQAWWRIFAVALFAWLAIDAAVARLRGEGHHHVPQVAVL